MPLRGSRVVARAHLRRDEGQSWAEAESISPPECTGLGNQGNVQAEEYQDLKADTEVASPGARRGEAGRGVN